ncbi:multidrug resistance protein D [Klebsiella pneumoniae]|uniref:Multidrug resistance protein D n=1 Tax=Klebsiella pneumoniae TaxID=573 RepID=A0A3S4IR32_KLEPN|nr:multidrug resistance protein D [Klebsiella pneumoniae]
MMPQTGQGSLGLLMMLMGLLILLCWLPLASRFTPPSAAGISAAVVPRMVG